METKIENVCTIVAVETVAQTIFKCDRCEYKFDDKSSLDQHMKEHSVEKFIACAHCSASFKSQLQLNNHLNVHIGLKPFKCPACELSFTTRGELIRHTKYKHTLEKPHKCNQCEYATVESTKLKRHMRTHTGERPYLCPQCDYAGCDTFKLKRHMRTHTGEKPYECPLCQCSFNQSGTLKKHIAGHKEQQNTFKCPHCPLEFLKLTVCETHVKDKHPNGEVCNTPTKELAQTLPIVEFPHTKLTQEEIKKVVGWIKCEHCEMSFGTKEALDEHTIMHTGERPYECESCGIKFAHKFALRAHISSHLNPIRRSPKTPASKSSTVQLAQVESLACLLCSINCESKDELERHMSEEHSLIENEEIHVKAYSGIKRGRKKKIHDTLEDSVLKKLKLEKIF